MHVCIIVVTTNNRIIMLCTLFRDEIFGVVRQIVRDSSAENKNKFTMTLDSMEQTGSMNGKKGQNDSDQEPYKAHIDIVTYERISEQMNAVKPRILVDFGEHGRELITTEVAVGFLKMLGDDAELERIVKAFHLDDIFEFIGDDGWSYRELLDAMIIKTIPMENVHGRDKVEGGDLCERKNGRGVDPNRNWGVDWGAKEPDYDPNEEYPGTEPFSEPEAMILRDLARSFKPDVFINVHSGMEAFFVPYDYRKEIAYGENVNATLDVLNGMNQRFCDGSCAVGSGGAKVGYLAHGTVTDYMHQVLNIPISMTWEIYGDFKADYEDCFRMFNPIGEEHVDTFIDRWTATLLYFIASLYKHPATENKFHKPSDEGTNVLPEPVEEPTVTETESPDTVTNPKPTLVSISTDDQQMDDHASSWVQIAIAVIPIMGIVIYRYGMKLSQSLTNNPTSSKNLTPRGTSPSKTDDILPRFMKRKKQYISIS
jgi:hypothetical protein